MYYVQTADYRLYQIVLLIENENKDRKIKCNAQPT